jgi:hypothetical protein
MLKTLKHCTFKVSSVNAYELKCIKEKVGVKVGAREDQGLEVANFNALKASNVCL